MKKKNCILFIVLFLVLTLTSCEDSITSGEVVTKTFKPAHTQLLMLPMSVYNGKSISTVLVPYTYYYSDSWEVTIQQHDKTQNKMLQATYRVAEEVYNDIEIGAEFVYSEKLDPDMPEYYRERN